MLVTTMMIHNDNVSAGDNKWHSVVFFFPPFAASTEQYTGPLFLPKLISPHYALLVPITYKLYYCNNQSYYHHHHHRCLRRHRHHY